MSSHGRNFQIVHKNICWKSTYHSILIFGINQYWLCLLPFRGVLYIYKQICFYFSPSFSKTQVVLIASIHVSWSAPCFLYLGVLEELPYSFFMATMIVFQSLVFTNKPAGNNFVHNFAYVGVYLSTDFLEMDLHFNFDGFCEIALHQSYVQLLLPIALPKQCAIQKPFDLCQSGEKWCLSIFLIRISLTRSEFEQLLTCLTKQALFHLTALLLAIIFKVCRERPVLFYFQSVVDWYFCKIQ